MVEVIQLYSEIYDIMAFTLNSEVKSPCLFFIVIVRSLVSSNFVSRLQIALSLLQQLYRESVSLMAWKSNPKLLVIPNFDFKLLGKTLIEIDLLQIVMNHDDSKIRESAAIVLCFECYSNSYKEFSFE